MANARHQNDQTRVELINEWREQRQHTIDDIVREAIKRASDLERANGVDSFQRQLSVEDVNNRKQDLFDHLDELLEQSLEKQWTLSAITEINGDDSVLPDDSSVSTPSDLSLPTSPFSYPNEDHDLMLEHSECQRIPCDPDSDNGAMALHKHELVFANIVRQRNRQWTEICVVTNCTVSNTARRLPFIDSNKRVVDIDYSTHYKCFVLAANKVAPAQCDGNDEQPHLYLFDTQNDSLTRWMPFAVWETIQRVCCTSSYVYVIVQSFGQSAVARFPNDNSTGEQKSASDLISLPSGQRFRLIDISCSASIRQAVIAIAYNGAEPNGNEGPIGICLFDTNWVRLATIADLGTSSMPYCVPRLTWLNKPNCLAMVNLESGDLIVFSATGQKLSITPFARFTEDSVSGRGNFNPVNICATDGWAAVRYGHFINVHCIND